MKVSTADVRDSPTVIVFVPSVLTYTTASNARIRSTFPSPVKSGVIPALVYSTAQRVSLNSQFVDPIIAERRRTWRWLIGTFTKQLKYTSERNNPTRNEDPNQRQTDSARM
jgi:hypothetical protein